VRDGLGLSSFIPCSDVRIVLLRAGLFTVIGTAAAAGIAWTLLAV
jgi:hypothetical protein